MDIKYQIQITNEATGEVVLNIGGVDEFMALIKRGQDITRSFSTNDTILQLGMLGFVKEKIRHEINQLPEKK